MINQSSQIILGFTLNFAHSMDFDKCSMSMYPSLKYYTKWFHLKVLCAPSICPSFPSPWKPLILYCLHNFLECYRVRITQYVVGEGNGNPLQCSCLENPRDGEAWWAAVYGVAQSRTQLKRRSSSSIQIGFFHLVMCLGFFSWLATFFLTMNNIPFNWYIILYTSTTEGHLNCSQVLT